MKRLLAAALLLTGGGLAAQEVPPAPDIPAQRFAAMDTDGDGRVDSAEWDRAVSARAAAAPLHGATRRAPDAPLPLPTARRTELMRALFGRIDSDGDGGLTLDEVRAFGRALGAERAASSR